MHTSSRNYFDIQARRLHRRSRSNNTSNENSSPSDYRFQDENENVCAFQFAHAGKAQGFDTVQVQPNQPPIQTDRSTFVVHNGRIDGDVSHQWDCAGNGKCCIVFQLHNVFSCLFQINFLDHFKLILDSRDGTVTIMMPKQLPKTLSFASIECIALPSNIHSRLKFAMVKVKYLMGHLKKSKSVRRKLRATREAVTESA